MQKLASVTTTHTTLRNHRNFTTLRLQTTKHKTKLRVYKQNFVDN